MPIYNYRCEDCGATSEFLVKVPSEDMSLICPQCDSQSLEKLISAPSLLKNKTNTTGTTCCGREERCETSPCSTGAGCRRSC